MNPGARNVGVDFLRRRLELLQSSLAADVWKLDIRDGYAEKWTQLGPLILFGKINDQ